MAGIQQTNDVIRAIGIVAGAVKKASADGLDLKDLSVLTNREVQDSVVTAVTDISEVPGEIKDVDFQEIIALFVSLTQAVNTAL